jgi:hypothetical protein
MRLGERVGESAVSDKLTVEELRRELRKVMTI